MAVTPSTMKLETGAPAPDFALPNHNGDGSIIRLADFKQKNATLIFFACNHCPYVVHIAEAIADLAKDYLPKNVAIAAINSNDIQNYPEDAPEKMKPFAQKYGWTFPYLFDETQETARAYHAACTPDFFLFDKNHKLAYRGQLDDSRPGNSIPPAGEHLRAALDAVLQNKPAPANQKPSVGCNIKWKR